MFIPLLSIASVLLSVPWCLSREILELQAVNFELALTSYKYVAILFYDSSDFGRDLEQKWNQAADQLDDLYTDSEMAKIDGADVELKELIDAYSIMIPCVKVFRRGVMADYRGPYDTKGMIRYLREDSQPSVKMVKSLPEIQEKLKGNKKTVVLGFFDTNDIIDDNSDSYSIDPWGQFQAAADSLRGHATFYGIASEESLLQSFQVAKDELPVVYLISEDKNSLLPYTGEILEMNLSEWVLRHSAPAMGELVLNSPTGEVYATQFFASRKLKFILFLSGGDSSMRPKILAMWQSISELFKGTALFAYMVRDAVPDVLQYFDIDATQDLPIIVAHEPTKDSKYKSERHTALDNQTLHDFVAGVVSGVTKKVMKSESIKPKGRQADKGPVVRAVGANVVDIVSELEKDVLLEVYAPWCAHCKKLMPTYDILGRAVQAEDRIVIAKIDHSANDLPASWAVKSYPTLLWFPAKDKPYDAVKGPVPRPYWEAGQSLHDLVSFVQRQGSFDAKTLKIATSEQLGSLLGDEETLRAKYLLDEAHEKRNQGRELFANEWIDFIAGEVVFDGKRWHVVVAGLLALLTVVATLAALVYYSIAQKTGGGKGPSAKKQATAPKKSN